MTLLGSVGADESVYERCEQRARETNHRFFARQGEAGGCYGSNDLARVTSVGPSARCAFTDGDGRNWGAPDANFVYDREGAGGTTPLPPA